jgi:hypothetical protein
MAAVCSVCHEPALVLVWAEGRSDPRCEEHERWSGPPLPPPPAPAAPSPRAPEPAFDPDVLPCGHPTAALIIDPTDSVGYCGRCPVVVASRNPIRVVGEAGPVPTVVSTTKPEVRTVVPTVEPEPAPEPTVPILRALAGVSSAPAPPSKERRAPRRPWRWFLPGDPGLTYAAWTPTGLVLGEGDLREVALAARAVRAAGVVPLREELHVWNRRVAGVWWLGLALPPEQMDPVLVLDRLSQGLPVLVALDPPSAHPKMERPA